MLRVWVDDMRPAPAGWTWAKTSAEGIALVPDADVMSLDHDLGGEDTGYRVLLVIEDRAAEGMKPPILACHSANPVGRSRMEAAIASIYRVWTQW